MAPLGVRPGDRVLMTLPNCPESVVLFLAAQKLGARLVNAGPLLGADDLAHLMRLTEPRLVACLDLQTVTSGRLDDGRTESVPHLFVSLSGYQGTWRRLGYWYKLWKGEHREGTNANGYGTTFTELLETAPPRPPTVRPDPDDVAVLQPTGGTTGVLKVAQLSHRNLLTNATQLCAWTGLVQGQGSVLGVLPMFHAYGLTTVLIAGIYCAGTLLPLTRFRVDQLMATVRRHRPTVLPLVPTIIHQLSEELDRRPDPEFCDALRRGNMAEASEAYRTLIGEHPDQVMSQQQQLDLANQLMSEGRYEAAASAYELFLKHFPSYPNIHQIRLILGLTRPSAGSISIPPVVVGCTG